MLNLCEEKKFLEAIDLVKASIYWKDLGGHYLVCNQYMLNLLGIERREDVIGKTDADLFDFDEAAALRVNDQIVVEKGTYEGEENITSANGKKVGYWSIKSQLLNAQGDVVGINGTSFSIHGHKARMELEKRRAVLNERLQVSQIIDLVNASIYWKDLNGTMLGCNQYVLDIFGASEKDQLIGKNEYEFLPKDEAEKIRKIDQSVIENGRYVGEETFTIADGKEITVLTVKNQLLDNAGNIIGLVGTSLDITAQKEAVQLKLEMERERQQKEMLEVEKKSQQFLAEQQEKFKEVVEKAVHDINTPLTIIGGGINSCNGLLPEEQLTRLQQAYDNVLFILKDLAKNYKIKIDSPLSKIESRQDLLIMDFVSDVLEDKKFQYLRHPINFELSTTEAVKTAHIDAQSGRLGRALSNLLNNAIDALPKNNGVIKVALDTNEDSVFITISDNGRGMTPEAVQRILERISFTENKTNGHGVGLKQVWEALEYNRGSMKVESTVGKGTSFKLTFPRFEPTNWIAQEIVLYRDTILLILDDNKEFHESWKYHLNSKIGGSRASQVKYFCEGVEALNFVNALAEEDRKRILLLADYELANQTLTGLDIIISCNMTNAILITGHANDAGIRHSALMQGITLLPKTLISDIPIKLVKDPLQVA